MFNSNQYNPQGYSTSYPNYTYSSNQYYMGYGQAQPSYVSGTVQPVPPGEDFIQTGWNYVDPTKQQALPQTVTVNAAPNNKTAKDENKGVLEERKQQKLELIKQRDEYERRVSVLRRELEMLRKQKQELISEGAIERDTNHILRENGKLQIEIQNKLKDAHNVIEILSGIIGESSKSNKEDSPKESDTHRRSSGKNSSEKFNYIHYDPEVHWCRICDIFPRTAKDFLMHLHSGQHKKLVQDENIENPWHKLPRDPEFPVYEGASKKRLPIKGLQFIISSTAWYCRLCDTWIGDLHCASHHLKSLTHSQNYTNFVEQNPHWEIEWLKDREKALERTRQNRSSESEDDESKKRKKHKKSPLNMSNKDKKKKKRSKKRKKQSSDTSSTSSSSESSSDDEKNDKSKSIRVAMRNKIKAQLLQDDVDSKWEVLGRLVEERKRKEASQITDVQKKVEEDSLITQWMSVKEPQDKDKLMLENLKDRMKKKQDAEKAKFLEMEQQRKEKEKLEQEQREREEEETRLREEQKRREQEEAMRLKEKDREQVRFKPKEKYRRRRSSSQSPERRRSRSPSNERRRSRYSSERRRKYSENGRRSRSRSISPPNRYRRKEDIDKKDRKSSSSKKLPFIGRMPLFKNKKPENDKVEKEIKKEDYEPQRVTRFQPGNLARAFIPQPDVVCFPRLSTYPPAPPPPAPVIIAEPPAPPKIGIPPKAPPPPKINNESPKNETKDKESARAPTNTASQDAMTYDQMDPNDIYQFEYNMYQTPPYDYTNDDIAAGAENAIAQHSLPLQPPPLPPDDPIDDLALLGISSDDLAAQLF